MSRQARLGDLGTLSQLPTSIRPDVAIACANPGSLPNPDVKDLIVRQLDAAQTRFAAIRAGQPPAGWSGST